MERKSFFRQKEQTQVKAVEGKEAPIVEEKELPLHLKYRPKNFKEVVGQKHIVNSLSNSLNQKSLPHSFLFAGPSGTGKTTLARIVAGEVGCGLKNIIEIDAAVYTGVDDMRALCDGLKYGAVGDNPTKFVIIDECHMLSKSGWNSLLKIVEDTPKHVFFAFCTTELGKVPQTIQTRCHNYNLKDVMMDDLLDLLDYVCKEEDINLPKGGAEVIAKESYGSPRRCLVYLSKCRFCDSKEDVIRTLESAEGSTEVIDLCRLLISPQCDWFKAMSIIKILKDQNPESIRIQISNYVTACSIGSKSEGDAIRFLKVSNVFSKPIYQATGLAEIVLAIGEICFAE